MAWTAPRTWTTGEVVTASHMNTHVRDNLLETAPAKATTAGDLFVGTGANALKRLGIGAARKAVAANPTATDIEYVESLASLLTFQGDIPYASAANTPARLAKGTARQRLWMNAGATAPEWVAGLLDAQYTATSVANTTSETDLYSFSVPGNSMTLNGALVLVLGGFVTCNAAGTLTLRIKVAGAAELTSNAFDLVDNASSRYWRLVVEIKPQNNLAQSWLHALFEVAAPGGAFQVASSDAWVGVGGTQCTQDFASAQTLAVSAQWSAASTSLNITRRPAYIEVF